MKRYNRQKAFTLIELLVVIAIIALLLSIIMPALGKVKEQARTAVCAAHLKQFGLAWYFYAEDNDDSNVEFVDNPSQGHYWFYRLAPYVGGSEEFARAEGNTNTRDGIMKILICPSARPWKDKYGDGDPYGAADMAWKWWQDEKIQGGYAINRWMQNRAVPAADPTIDYYPRKYGRTSDRAPLISDAGWSDVWPEASEGEPGNVRELQDLEGAGFSGPKRMGMSLPRLAIKRHGKGINVVFKGGHVEKIPLHKLWSLNWHDGFEPVYELEFPTHCNY